MAGYAAEFCPALWSALRGVVSGSIYRGFSKHGQPDFSYVADARARTQTGRGTCMLAIARERIFPFGLVNTRSIDWSCGAGA